MKKILSMLTMAFALCLALVGCGGGADYSKNFIGTWEISSMESDGESMDEETMDMMRAWGMNCVLTFEEDGKLTLDLFGDALEGTWKAKDASTASVTIDGDTVDATLKDDKLTMEQDGDTLVFVLNNDAVPTDPSALEDGDDGLDDGDDTSTEESIAINEVIIDDDTCTVELLDAAVDWAGDPGFNFKVTNNTDKTICFGPRWDTWSVDGKMIDPYSSVTVKPGAYGEFFMYFDSDELGGGIEALTNIDGKLYAYDDDSWDDLAEWDFTY